MSTHLGRVSYREAAKLAIAGALCGTVTGAVALVTSVQLALAVGVAVSVTTLGMIVIRGGKRNRARIDQIRASFALAKLVEHPQLWWRPADYVAKPDFLLAILQAIEERKPRSIVELGSGVSTVVVASFLRQHRIEATVTSIEHDKTYAARTQADVERFALSDWVRVVTAPLKPYSGASRSALWYSLEDIEGEISEIDLLIVDGPPAHIGRRIREPALEVMSPFLTPGALVMVDDANRMDGRRMLQRWRRSSPGISVAFEATEAGLGLVTWRSEGGHREAQQNKLNLARSV